MQHLPQYFRNKCSLDPEHGNIVNLCESSFSLNRQMKINYTLKRLFPQEHRVHYLKKQNNDNKTLQSVVTELFGI